MYRDICIYILQSVQLTYVYIHIYMYIHIYICIYIYIYIYIYMSARLTTRDLAQVEERQRLAEKVEALEVLPVAIT